jgi:hypothetical protein
MLILSFGAFVVVGENNERDYFSLILEITFFGFPFFYIY